MLDHIQTAISGLPDQHQQAVRLAFCIPPPFDHQQATDDELVARATVWRRERSSQEAAGEMGMSVDQFDELLDDAVRRLAKDPCLVTLARWLSADPSGSPESTEPVGVAP